MLLRGSQKIPKHRHDGAATWSVSDTAKLDHCREHRVHTVGLWASAIHTGVSRISPFRGLLYDLSRVGRVEDVTSPPYDVITDQQQKRLRDASRYNVVHLEFNERGADSERRAGQYTQAASLLKEWRGEGAVALDDEPAFYPYQMDFTFAGRSRRIRGLICAVDVEPWGGSIIPHEHTMERQVDDRLGLMREVGANLSPVYSVFSGPITPLDDLLDGLGEPLISLADEEGVRHGMWRLHSDQVPDWLSSQNLLIADGHHRYTVALQYRDEMRERFGPGPWDRIMMLIVDAVTEDPPVLPIHRVLLHGRPPAPTAAAAGMTEMLGSVSDDRLVCGIVTPAETGLAFGTLRLEGEPPTVNALHQQVLDAIAPQDSLRFTADADDAESAVASGEASAAFFLPPTTAGRIRTVIDRSERMPQKSTFFWPKPRTGMVMRPME